jgi:hypothetical protein
MRRVVTLCVLLSLSLSVHAAEEPPKFTDGPVAVKVGGKVRITFTVDRATDVAVFVEDAKGNIVRHLVAGVLGPNAPAPLKKNSLEQSVEWDSKADYGKPAGAGPFRVRIALAMGAAFDKVLMEDRQSFTGGKGGVKALAAGPGGTLYVLSSFGAAVPNWTGERIVALDRDGKYLRTVHPFSAGLKKEQLAGYGTVELDGQTVPLVHSVAGRGLGLTGTNRKTAMCVTPDGAILRPVGGLQLSAVGTDGSTPYGKETGPSMLKLSPGYFGRAFLCPSSDGKYVYVAGMGYRPLNKRKRRDTVPFNAVYRVKLPERTPAVEFFGKRAETGADRAHLGGAPCGLATDGKGHLLIGDPANGRVVVVSEKDGTFVGSFKVGKVDHIGVDPGSRAVYLTRLPKEREMVLEKRKSWKEPVVVASQKFTYEGDPRQPWVMALTPRAVAGFTLGGDRPAVVWIGGDRGSLYRVEDKGAAFAKPVKVSKVVHGNAAFVDCHVDRFRPDREIYFRCGQGTWYRFNEKSGKTTKVVCRLSGGSGSCIAVGPRGNLHMVGWPYHLFRFTRDGKPLPWGFKGYPDEALGKTGKLQKVRPGPKHGLYSPTSMTYMTHSIGVRQDGHFFVFEPGHAGGRPPKMLIEYTPDGRKVDRDPIIWKVSDTAIGPKFDAAGNIYVAEQVKPVGQPYPPEFIKKFGPLNLGKNNSRSRSPAGVQKEIATMYGSIVKFSPKGGMFHFGGEDPFKGKQPNLPDGLKTELATSFHKSRLYPLRVTGAEWIHMGISHVDLFYCNCENTRFDVDEFGRVFYPDLGRYRVGVIDTNGNPIMHFGMYGNADDAGITFAWLIGVGATDRYMYMGDSVNRRAIRARLTYAEEKTCEIK